MNHCWICDRPIHPVRGDKYDGEIRFGKDGWLTRGHRRHLWCRPCLIKHSRSFSHRWDWPSHKEHSADAEYHGSESDFESGEE
jgi:hypothetical protein